MGWSVEEMELFSSITEDHNLQVAAAAALLSAVCYQLAMKGSQVLSPRLCGAKYSRLKPAERLDWDSRLPSTIHAVVVSALCIWCLCCSSLTTSGSDNNDSALPVVLRSNTGSFTVIGLSGGYFLMDAALLAAVPQLGSREMVVHHTVALLSLAVAAQVATMHVYLLAVLLSELTTPFVNLRWWLDKADLKALPLYTVNGLALMAVWGLARVALFLPFYAHVTASWATVQDEPIHALVLLLGVPLLLGGLNLMWFIKIVRGAMKLVSGGGGNSKQQVQATQAQQAHAPAAVLADCGAIGLCHHGKPQGLLSPRVVAIQAFADGEGAPTSGGGASACVGVVRLG